MFRTYFFHPTTTYYSYHDKEILERDLNRDYDCGDHCATEFIDKIVGMSKEGEINVRSTKSLLRTLMRRVMTKPQNQTA